MLFRSGGTLQVNSVHPVCLVHVAGYWTSFLILPDHKSRLRRHGVLRPRWQVFTFSTPPYGCEGVTRSTHLMQLTQRRKTTPLHSRCWSKNVLTPSMITKTKGSVESNHTQPHQREPKILVLKNTCGRAMQFEMLRPSPSWTSWGGAQSGCWEAHRRRRW